MVFVNLKDLDTWKGIFTEENASVILASLASVWGIVLINGDMGGSDHFGWDNPWVGDPGLYKKKKAGRVNQ